MKQEFDWNTRIMHAEQKGEFDTDDVIKAGDWELCKASETLPLRDDFANIIDNPYKRITNKDIYAKYGPMIEDLGYMFTDAVKNNDIMTARDMAKELDNSSELYIRLHRKTEPYTEEHSLKLLKRMFSRWNNV